MIRVFAVEVDSDNWDVSEEEVLAALEEVEVRLSDDETFAFDVEVEPEDDEDTDTVQLTATLHDWTDYVARLEEKTSK